VKSGHAGDLGFGMRAARARDSLAWRWALSNRPAIVESRTRGLSGSKENSQPGSSGRLGHRSQSGTVYFVLFEFVIERAARDAELSGCSLDSPVFFAKYVLDVLAFHLL